MSRGSVRQRSKLKGGSWTVQVYLGRDGETGKKVYRAETVKGSKAVAERRLRELLGQLETVGVNRPVKMTVAGYLDEWPDGDACARTRLRTLDGYRRVVELYLKPALGRIQLERLAARDVR